MGVSNPVEAVVGILTLMDEVRAKMKGTPLADVPWRPVSSESIDILSALTHEPMARCDDITEAVIVVTVAAMIAASREVAPSQ
jgi:hypothetical protein